MLMYSYTLVFRLMEPTRSGFHHALLTTMSDAEWYSHEPTKLTGPPDATALILYSHFSRSLGFEHLPPGLNRVFHPPLPLHECTVPYR